MKMRKIAICLLLVLICLCGCKPSIESRIEKEFLNYVQNNFDDPNSLQEIVSILPKDTVKIQEMFAMLRETLENDSLISAPLSSRSYQEILMKMQTASFSERKKYQEEGRAFLTDKIEIAAFCIKYMDEFDNIKNSIIEHIDSTTLTGKDFIYTYEIKFRAKEKGEKKLLSYYAIFKTDNYIKIQDHELRTEEIPMLKAVVDKIDRYFELKEENFRLLKKAAESERIFSNLLN